MLKIDDRVADHVYVRLCSICSVLHSGQTHDACAVPAIILQRKIGTNVESFTITLFCLGGGGALCPR